MRKAPCSVPSTEWDGCRPKHGVVLQVEGQEAQSKEPGVAWSFLKFVGWLAGEGCLRAVVRFLHGKQ